MKILSVIVPSYDMEGFLPKCLGSLAVDAALREHLEVLVINDGSRDRTSAIAHEFAAKDPSVFRVIDKENGNYGSCVNRGLAEASGFYVKVLDADDYVDTAAFAEYLKILVEESSKNESAADLVVTDYAKVGPDGKVSGGSRYGLREGISTLADKPAGTSWMSVQSVTYRTDNLRRIGYRQTEGCSYSDSEWITEPLITVRRLRYIPLVVTLYLFGREGQTMEEATYARNFGQVVALTKSMVSRHEQRLREAVPEAREYYYRQIVRLVEICYYHILFGYEGRRVCLDVGEFDDFMSQYQALYRETEALSVRHGRFIEFHYVREWRRRHSSATVRFVLYAVFCRLNAIRHWLKRRYMKKRG